MFEQAFAVASGRTRRAWTVPVGFAGQLVIVGAAVVMPLLWVDKMSPNLPTLQPPVRLGRPDLPDPKKNSVEVVDVRRLPPKPRPFTTPIRIPDRVAVLLAEDTPPVVQSGSRCTGDCTRGQLGMPDGIYGGPPPVWNQRLDTTSPPTETRVIRPVAQQKPPDIVPIPGGVVEQSLLLHRVMPVYPEIARRTRTSGVVRLAAIIGTDGRIRELQLMSGHPWLAEAAMDAVRQWLYKPTLLNGSPVEVRTEVTVYFNLAQ